MTNSILLLPLCCLLLGMGCKPTAREIDGPYLAGSVYAIVDSQHFEGLYNSAMVSDSTLVLTASGSSGNSEPLSLQFHLGHFHGAGHYDIDAAVSAGVAYANDTFVARTGYVEVGSSSNGHITGTFAFAAFKDGAARQVSAGRFELFQ
jgi:hypothetical protein